MRLTIRRIPCDPLSSLPRERPYLRAIAPINMELAGGVIVQPASTPPIRRSSGHISNTRQVLLPANTTPVGSPSSESNERLSRGDELPTRLTRNHRSHETGLRWMPRSARLLYV